MKKLLKSGVSILAIATTIFMCSNAFQGIKVSENAVLCDENMVLINTVNVTELQMRFEDIEDFKKLDFQGNTLRLFFFNPQNLNHIPLTYIDPLPQDLKNQITNAIDDHKLSTADKYFDEIKRAIKLNDEQVQLLTQIETYKQNLKHLANEIHHQINANEKIKNALIKLSENKKLKIKNIYLIKNNLDINNFSIKFHILEQEDMDNEDYYQCLKEIYQQWLGLRKALVRISAN